jgi:hypothetical protein
MKKIKNMFLVLATVMFYLALETPIYAGFNPGKQGKGIFFFNIAVVILVVIVGGYIWWKKRQEDDGE